MADNELVMLRATVNELLAQLETAQAECFLKEQRLRNLFATCRDLGQNYGEADAALKTNPDASPEFHRDVLRDIVGRFLLRTEGYAEEWYYTFDFEEAFLHRPDTASRRDFGIRHGLVIKHDLVHSYRGVDPFEEDPVDLEDSVWFPLSRDVCERPEDPLNADPVRPMPIFADNRLAQHRSFIAEEELSEVRDMPLFENMAKAPVFHDRPEQNHEGDRRLAQFALIVLRAVELVFQTRESMSVSAFLRGATTLNALYLVRWTVADLACTDILERHSFMDRNPALDDRVASTFIQMYKESDRNLVPFNNVKADRKDVVRLRNGERALLYVNSSNRFEYVYFHDGCRNGCNHVEQQILPRPYPPCPRLAAMAPQ